MGTTKELNYVLEKYLGGLFCFDFNDNSLKIVIDSVTKKTYPLNDTGYLTLGIPHIVVAHWKVKELYQDAMFLIEIFGKIINYCSINKVYEVRSIIASNGYISLWSFICAVAELRNLIIKYEGMLIK